MAAPIMASLFDTLEDRNLARLREVIAGRFTDWHITPRQTELLRQIECRRGQRNMIAGAELCTRLRCKRRELSADVQELRLLGIGIGTSRDADASGYYLITTDDELRATLSSYLRQALTELRIVKALDHAGFHTAFGQLRLQLFPDDAKTLEQGFLEAANG